MKRLLRKRYGRARGIIYPACDECGCTGEHEVWCSVSPEAIPASIEVMWAAVTHSGEMLTRFAFLADATAPQLRAYAEKRLNRLAAAGGAVITEPYDIVRVIS
jgi:hypothetical protein